jgi:hypothetical protein
MTIDEKIYYGPELFISPVTANVVYDVIRKLKLNRAPGEDCINAELIKNRGKHLSICIFDLILEIWNKEVMPADWRTAVICPIHKKDSKLECNNYRGTSLLNVTYKIFINILTKYIETYTEEFIGQYQCGFHKGRSTTDHIFSLRQIIEKFYEQTQNYISYRWTLNKHLIESVDHTFLKP